MASVEEMFRRHHLSLFRFLRRMTGSAEQAEDLTQETFLRLVRSPAAADRETNEPALLFQIARNLLLNLRRDEGRKRLTGSPEELPTAAPRQAEAVDLNQALGGLQKTDREIFLMRELGGLTYEEIARVRSITPDAVRSRIYRARTALRAALSESPHRRWKDSSEEARP